MKALLAIPALLATVGLGFLFSKPAKAAPAAPTPEPEPDGPTPQPYQDAPLPGGGGGAPAWTQPTGADPITWGPQEPAPVPGFPPSGLWPQSPLQTGPTQPSPGFPPMQLPVGPQQAPIDIPTQVAQAAQAAPGLPQHIAGARTLKLTSPVTKGSDVMALQVMLNGSGANPRLKLDGAYGPGTVAAVKKYQSSRKLTADGITGKSTWASLTSQVPAQATAAATSAATSAASAATAVVSGLPSFAPGSRTIKVTTPAMKGTDVLALQVMLNGAGANPPLKPDGVYGPAAARATRVYQASRKLTADGVVGPGTWRSLLAAVPSTSTASSSTSGTTRPTTQTTAATAQLAANLPPFAPGSRTLKSVRTPMRGTDVLALQVLLNEAGASPELKLDGSYGPGTVAAVKKFQTAHKLLADGQVGANTWNTLRKTGGAAAPDPVKPVAIPASVSTAGLAMILPGSRTLRAAVPAMTGADVVAAQTLLNKAGAVPALKLDGVYGPGSVAAVKRYQKAKGLTADGILGATTWTSLKKYDAPATAPVATPTRQTPMADVEAPPSGLAMFAEGSRVIRLKSPAMKGTDVWVLQGRLNRAGFSPVLVRDGAYGPASVKAARWFQSQRGLTVDGVVGPATLAALQAATTSSSGVRVPPPPPQLQQIANQAQQAGAATAAAYQPTITRAAAAMPATPLLPSIPGLAQHPVGSRTIRLQGPAMKGTDVLMLQASLNMAGANPPLVLDGAYGPAGVAAAKAYQTRNRLTADGVVGPATWAVLQGGSVGAILEDPLREAAQELTAHLRSIGGIEAAGREDKALVQNYQRAEGIRSDGLYSPGDAARILKHGLVPVAPFYWASDDTARNKQRDVFLAQVKKGQELNPPQASLYEKLRADTIKRLGEVSK